MAKAKRSVRPEFIFVAVIVGLFIFSLLMSWWETHAPIGWAIVGVLVAAFIFSLYRLPGFRSWIFKTGVSASKKVVFEDSAPGREPIPVKLYKTIMNRANNHCENPSCQYNGKPEIHHINMNNSDNTPGNLIALCPNCHNEAHNGKLTYSQIKNFVKYSLGKQRYHKS